MNWLKNLLPKNSFARGVSVLVGGTVGAQALILIASPILTRLYTPEDFGFLAIFASILSMLTVVSNLSYEQAIPLPEEEKKAIHIVVICILLTILITVITSLAILLMTSDLMSVLGQPKISNYFWLLPFGVFFIGCYQTFYYWALRNKSFATISKTKIYQSVTTILIQILGFKFGALALMLGQTSGQAVGLTSLAKPVLTNPRLRNWKWLDLKKTAIRYKHFPMFSTWSSLLNTAGTQLPPLLFAFLFSTSTAGLYSIAHKVLALPMGVVGSAIGNVFFSNAADAHRRGDLAILFESVYSKLVSIIMPITLVLMIDAPRLFSLVFGENWVQAGILARWMSPWLAIVFISSPLSLLYTVLEKQREGMYFQLIMLFARVIAIMIGAHYTNIYLAIILFSLSSVICWMGFLIWAAINAESKPINLIKPLALSFIYSLGCTTPLIINAQISSSNVHWYISLLLTAILTLIYYYVIIYRKSLKP